MFLNNSLTRALGTVSLLALFFFLTPHVSAQAPIRLSDQKAGSILVYPFYSSDGTQANDTRLTITHVGPSGGVRGSALPGGLGSAGAVLDNLNVHLLWIDSTCSQADGYICLTKFQSSSFRASDWDPATASGYMIAIAIDPLGNPIAYDGLIGSEFINCNVKQGGFTERWLDSFGAEAFAAVGNTPNPIPPGPQYWYTTTSTPAAPAPSAPILFNNGPFNTIRGYDAAAGSFAVEFQSVIDATGQTLVTVGLNGTVGGSVNGNGFGNNNIGAIYRNDEKIFSWTAPGDACILLLRLSTTVPRIVSGMGVAIGTGKTGTLMWSTTGGAVGVFVTPQAGNNRWVGVRNLHKRSAATSTLVVPIFPPNCIV